MFKIRIVLTCFVLFALSSTAAFASSVVKIRVDDTIQPISAEYIDRAIEQARQTNADAVLIELRTPGGLVDSTREIIQKILNSPVPVIVYVAPTGANAASAGFFILESADIAAMAPGTNTGAAHPVLMTGEMDALMKEKVENDAAAEMRSICNKRGRNSALAETAVRESKSFTEKEALDNRLIDLVAADTPALLAALEGRTVTRFDGHTQTLELRGAIVERYQKTWRQRIVSAIADPNIALVLLVIGALAIYIEFSSPGLIAPGVVGAILVLLGLSAISVLPINWLGAALLLVSFTLFALEAKFAAHGVLAVGGTVSMVLGAVMLIDSPLPELRIHLSTAIGLALPFAVITATLVWFVVRARRNKVVTGEQGMIGETGSAVTELAPSGKVFVHGEYWNAVALQNVPAGAQVRVTAIRQLTLSVEPVADESGG